MSSMETQIQVRGVMELEIVGKRKYKCPSELWEECLKNDMQDLDLSKRIQKIVKDGMARLKPKLPTLAYRDNGIKTDIVVFTKK